MAINTPYVRWAGEPGQKVEFLAADGTWKTSSRVEHAESAGYVANALSDPNVLKLFELNAKNPAALNNEQQAFFSNVLYGLDSVGQGGRWGAVDLWDNLFSPQQAGALIQSGGTQYLNSTDWQAGANFNQEQSPAAQSARAENGGLFGGGFLAAAAAIAMAIASSGTSLAATTAADAAYLAAADASAGLLPAFGSSAAYSAAIAQPSFWSTVTDAAKTAQSIGSAVNTGATLLSKLNGTTPTSSAAKPAAVNGGLSFNPQTGVFAMETPQGKPQQGATPQSTDLMPAAAPAIPAGLVLAAAAAAVFYLVR